MVDSAARGGGLPTSGYAERPAGTGAARLQPSADGASGRAMAAGIRDECAADAGAGRVADDEPPYAAGGAAPSGAA